MDKKQNINSISERINNLRKNNNLYVESNIKGVNNTNNFVSSNSKYSNFDKIFKSNSININRNSSSTNKNFNVVNPKSKPSNDFPKNQKREIGQFSNKNNFDLLEAQLNSLKNQTNKTKHNINKMYNQILGDNSANNLNMIKNFDEKYANNNINVNSSLEECEILANNLREN